jgi:putative transposase
MKVHKTYKFRIYPNKTQAELMAKHFGSTRFVWNHFLAKRKESYLKDKKSLNYHDNAKALTLLKKDSEFEWLKEINSQSLQASLKDLDTAYGRFFKKQAMFPRFKSKHKSIDSFRCPQGVDIRDGKLFLPKFREGVKVKLHREMTGTILFATISRTPTGKYFSSITCEVEHEKFPNSDKRIGIDLGIKDLAICSDGKVFENPRTTNKYAKKLTYEQRQLSKKKKGSGKRLKQRKKVAAVHETIKNKRLDNTHKTTHLIISENQTVIIEDLNVKDMIKNHCLAKAIADASWYELTRQLEYKAQWNGRDLIKTDRWFPSSKTCNVCNFINQNLQLKDREWTCPQCGTVLDRDLNASKNILKQGLRTISGCGAQSENKQKPGEASGT